MIRIGGQARVVLFDGLVVVLGTQGRVPILEGVANDFVGVGDLFVFLRDLLVLLAHLVGLGFVGRALAVVTRRGGGVAAGCTRGHGLCLGQLFPVPWGQDDF